MVCGTAVSAMNEAAQAAAAQAAAAAPEVIMPEVQAPNIPEVQVNIPDETVQTGAYFTDKANETVVSEAAAEEQPVYAQSQSQPADGQPVYNQPIYAQPQGQPADGQPVYAQPQDQPVYAQPAYTQPQGQPVYGQPVYTQPQGQQFYGQPAYGQPVLPPEAASLANSSMVMGIVALCLGLSFYFSLGGIILGAIGLAKSNEYYTKYGKLPAKGMVGRHLSRAGLIVGIIFSVLVLIGIIAIIADAM